LARLKPVLIFLMQSVVVGLAAAFVVVLVQPQLLPAIDGGRGANTGQPASYADAVDISAPAVASVYTRRVVADSDAADGNGRFRVNTGVGSAVIIDADGYLVTNFHVVAGANEIRLQLSDGRFTNPVLVVTQGIVSATGRGALGLVTFENFIQTDAAINAGNSGGALVNAYGQLVGINTMVLAQDVGTEGIGFAIPVDLVRGVVDAIKKDGRVIRGWIGMLPEELSRAELTELGLDPNIGIVLTSVIENGPAALAGLRGGDVILAIDNEPILSRQHALLIAARLNPGEQVEIEGWRDGQRFRATLTVTERSDQVQ